MIPDDPQPLDPDECARGTVRSRLATRGRVLLGTAAVGGAALTGCSEWSLGAAGTAEMPAEGTETVTDRDADVRNSTSGSSPGKGLLP